MTDAKPGQNMPLECGVTVIAAHAATKSGLGDPEYFHVFAGMLDKWPNLYGEEMKGNGIFLHTDPQDRPAEVFTGTTTIVSDAARQSYLLLPLIGPEND